jgi:hypothetical protein
MTIELDGEEHDWGMKMPLFEGISQAWKYRAWVDDFGAVHHVHDNSSSSRMRRTMWVEEDKLIIKVSLEEHVPQNLTWRVVASSIQKATRCEEE